MTFAEFYRLLTILYEDKRTHDLPVVMEADAGLADVGSVELDGVTNASTPKDVTVRINATGRLGR